MVGNPIGTCSTFSLKLGEVSVQLIHEGVGVWKGPFTTARRDHPEITTTSKDTCTLCQRDVSRCQDSDCMIQATNYVWLNSEIHYPERGGALVTAATHVEETLIDAASLAFILYLFCRRFNFQTFQVLETSHSVLRLGINCAVTGTTFSFHFYCNNPLAQDTRYLCDNLSMTSLQRLHHVLSILPATILFCSDTNHFAMAWKKLRHSDCNVFLLSSLKLSCLIQGINTPSLHFRHNGYYVLIPSFLRGPCLVHPPNNQVNNSVITASTFTFLPTPS